MNEKKNEIENLLTFGNLIKNTHAYEEVMTRHRTALLKGEFFYICSITNYKVFTAAYLFARGYYCGSGCKHCPRKPNFSCTHLH